MDKHVTALEAKGNRCGRAEAENALCDVHIRQVRTNVHGLYRAKTNLLLHSSKTSKYSVSYTHRAYGMVNHSPTVDCSLT